MTEEEKKEFEEFLEWKKNKEATKTENKQEQMQPSPLPTSTKRSPNGCLIILIILLVLVFVWEMSRCSSSTPKQTETPDSVEDWASDTLLSDDSMLGADFSSDTLDAYEVQVDTAARIDALKHIVKIKSAYLSSPNSASGVDAIFYYINKSDKTIKYLTWTGCAINAVGDMVSCDIRDSYFFRGKDTGPIKSGKTGGGTWSCAWYNWTAKKLKITQIEIEYMDGSTETINESEIKYVK